MKRMIIAALALLVVSGAGDVRQVSEFADKTVKRELESISGVGDITIVGGRPRQVNVWVHPDKLEAKQAQKLGTMATGLSIFALGGVLLLALPFVLRRKYPGRGRVLWKYSALAALLFFLAVNLFSGVLFAMRGAQANRDRADRSSIAVAPLPDADPADRAGHEHLVGLPQPLHAHTLLLRIAERDHLCPRHPG